MNYREIYQKWLNDPAFDADFIAELRSLTDEKEIEDRFYRALSFGTAGMRGVIGAGRNRINKYNIRKASQGYAEYLLSKNEQASCVIAHDNRRFSDYFAREAASVFAANGIKTYLFAELRSTPELSFAVRHLETTGGVVVTASHNPPQYNGYKVYGSDGAQLMPVEAAKVSAAVESIEDFAKIRYLNFETALADGLIQYIGEEVDAAYLAAVKKQIIRPQVYQQPLVVTYSPLHGAGAMIIERLLTSLDLTDVHYVTSQMVADSEFSTVKQPNPEEEQAFAVSLKLAEQVAADLLLASDPDADRVGVMVKTADRYQKLNGNQVGALLTHYVLSSKSNLPDNAIIVKTVVTSDLGMRIAENYGVACQETLTGFKFIGDKIKHYQQSGQYSFIMGYEESYGYLVGQHARDKDAVVTIMLIIEMAKYYKTQGKTLIDALDDLYAQYGYYKDHLIAKVLSGKSGMEQMQKIMTALRQTKTIGALPIVKVADFSTGQLRDLKSGNCTTLQQPQSNVLKYYLDDKNWFAVRPSGTEPKLKFYVSVVANEASAADQKIDSILTALDDFMAPYIDLC